MGRIALVFALLLTSRFVVAQELEPGAYWPLPVGMNILTVVNVNSRGDLTFDPSLPIDNASARINSTVGVYSRTLSVWGRSSNVSAQFPVMVGHVEGNYFGEPTEVDRFGQGDPRFRMAVNLYGAPSMVPRTFGSYRIRTLVGVSVTIAPPLGQYDNTKLVNIGANRWSIKPELGFARAKGPWVIELMLGAWMFTRNAEFAGTGTRTQRPIVSSQSHLTYRFLSRNMWLAADANFYLGGQTTVNGLVKADLQRNSRIGVTYSAALTPHHSIRASVSRGAITRIGGDFSTISAAYNYAWRK
jgi:hypothetical protein